MRYLEIIENSPANSESVGLRSTQTIIFIVNVTFIILGGPVAAKFAGNQLINLLSLLNNPNEPAVLKMVRMVLKRNTILK